MHSLSIHSAHVLTCLLQCDSLRVSAPICKPVGAPSRPHLLYPTLLLKSQKGIMFRKWHKPQISGIPILTAVCPDREIEARSSPEVLLTPLTVARNENERVLIEPSVNSVRISIKIKQADEIENILVHKFTRFLEQRAESFFILRRKPIKVREMDESQSASGTLGETDNNWPNETD